MRRWRITRLKREVVVEVEEDKFCNICHAEYHIGDEVCPPP